ncbi:MAG: alpha-L-rhamnosidase C-terminal domain-containing protein [Clostridia bacterium]
MLGVQILEPGCRKVAIRPQLGDLQWVEGAYPTPYGNIWIRHEKRGRFPSLCDKRSAGSGDRSK